VQRKEGAKTVYTLLVVMNYRESNQNAANYIVGLIAKLPLVSSDCDVGTTKLNNFDWTKSGISVFTRFQ